MDPSATFFYSQNTIPPPYEGNLSYFSGGIDNSQESFYNFFSKDSPSAPLLSLQTSETPLPYFPFVWQQEEQQESVYPQKISGARVLSRFLATFIFLALVVVGIGKVVFTADNPYLFLYLYGVSVTFVLLTVMFFSITRYRDPAEATDNAENNAIAFPYPFPSAFVSCMIAVHNEEKIITRCIESFLAQTYPYKEIIFVNDASTDRTAEILDWYASQGLIQVIHLEKNLGKKKALGTAMLQAQGEIFFFSDSDSVLAPDAVEKSTLIMAQRPDLGALSGHCRALNSEKNFLTKMQDSWYEGQFSVRKAFESIFGAVSCVSGPLAVFRREAIYNYIPAWENDSFLGQEFRFSTDRTLTGFVLGSRQIDAKLKKKYAGSPFVEMINYPPRDWTIAYAKSIHAWTEVPDTFTKFFKQQVRWKKSFIRNIFFTGTFYWRKPFLVSFFYYLHVLFVLMGPFIVFRHLVYLPMHGNALSAFLYLSGIAFVGLMFSFALKREEPTSDLWMYRPFMSLFSTIFLSPLLFYSLLTIKNNVWTRG
ncbi:MAG TPA: glycosyltransferase [Candidatus Paceibacterota bacterium]|nr:glycosyltransferase [Candidatus Paceibacterota bacterium]